MPQYTQDEQKVIDEAIAHAKASRTAIAKKLTNPDIYPPEKHPVAVFMAGSPGAGKTEASIELIAAHGSNVLRLDPDDLRSEFPGYNGTNSSLFQGAVSILVDRTLDRAFDQSQSFLLDGTLTKVEIARRNIERALRRDMAVQILYVYQEPNQAWQFVKARELVDGRCILPEDFIYQYFKARDVVNHLKGEFGQRIKVDVLLKDIDGSNRTYHANVTQIDSHIPEKYSESDLRKILGI